MTQIFKLLLKFFCSDNAMIYLCYRLPEPRRTNCWNCWIMIWFDLNFYNKPEKEIIMKCKIEYLQKESFLINIFQCQVCWDMHKVVMVKVKSGMIKKCIIHNWMEFQMWHDFKSILIWMMKMKFWILWKMM